jgi:hypothetical protein
MARRYRVTEARDFAGYAVTTGLEAPAICMSVSRSDSPVATSLTARSGRAPVMVGSATYFGVYIASRSSPSEVFMRGRCLVALATGSQAAACLR